MVRTNGVVNSHRYARETTLDQTRGLTRHKSRQWRTSISQIDRLKHSCLNTFDFPFLILQSHRVGMAATFAGIFKGLQSA